MDAHVACNVTGPSLVLYRPDTISGVGKIVCQGVVCWLLNIEWEGAHIVKALSRLGIAVLNRSTVYCKASKGIAYCTNMFQIIRPTSIAQVLWGFQRGYIGGRCCL